MQAVWDSHSRKLQHQVKLSSSSGTTTGAKTKSKHVTKNMKRQKDGVRGFKNYRSVSLVLKTLHLNWKQWLSRSLCLHAALGPSVGSLGWVSCRLVPADKQTASSKTGERKCPWSFLLGHLEHVERIMSSENLNTFPEGLVENSGGECVGYSSVCMCMTWWKWLKTT